MQARSRKTPKSDPEHEAPALDQLEEKFLACRDLRHAWAAAGYWKGNFGFVHRRLVCSRCKTVRLDRWEGGDVKRQYEYPDGYRVEGRVHAIDVRDELLRRVHVYGSQEEMMAALAGGKRRAATKPRSTTASRGRHAKVVDITDRSATRQHARARAAVSR